jgi:hypothetical protein
MNISYQKNIRLFFLNDMAVLLPLISKKNIYHIILQKSVMYDDHTDGAVKCSFVVMLEWHVAIQISNTINKF